MRRAIQYLVPLGIAACSAIARAQDPVGEEFQINTYTTYAQFGIVAGMTPSGDSLVVWGAASGVYSQRFSRDATRIGGEKPLSTRLRFATEMGLDQRGRSVFVGLWFDGNDFEITAHRCNSSGAMCASPLRVNTYTTGTQVSPSVAVDEDGDFVVVWASGHDYGTTGIFGQRVNRSGVLVGPEFQINTYTTGSQWRPSVASDSAGNFVVVWISNQDEGHICGQRFDATGSRVGAEFVVSSQPDRGANYPVVATTADVGFTVAWGASAGDLTDIHAQRFDRDGSRLGTEFRVNTYTTSLQWLPKVRMTPAGHFAIVWQDEARDSVYGQEYDRDGSPRGGEFRLSAYTSSIQNGALLAGDASGNLLVAWTSEFQDGDQSGVFGRRFGGIHAQGLSVDAAPTARSDGNGVLEPGESVTIAPSWFNATGVATSFSGRLSLGADTDPLLWRFDDGDAAYGPVPGGGVASCSSTGDCYSLSLRDVVLRPAGHWDGFVREELDHGLAFIWNLHVGESFRDVTRANPFYRHIETLLHRGATTGCAPNHYCPQSPAPRGDMAVLLLQGREGGGYLPPACDGSHFADVPFSDPRCPWIEELARRGVVSGCGGGNYCPGAPVTREQMAVFVLRTLDGALDPPGCTTPVFGDVPASSPYCRWIEELARRGVVTGCGGGNYCPTAAVTREQMSLFLSLTFGLSLYGA